MPNYHLNDILLNKYRIERLLGQGAFGEVYLVTHIKLNGQRAVKVLRADTPGFSAPQRLQDARERFELEARLYEIFHGSDLVQVFDFEEDHGILLLSMEYMPGGSLAARIEAAAADRTFDMLMGEEVPPAHAFHPDPRQRSGQSGYLARCSVLMQWQRSIRF